MNAQAAASPSCQSSSNCRTVPASNLASPSSRARSRPRQSWPSRPKNEIKRTSVSASTIFATAAQFSQACRVESPIVRPTDGRGARAAGARKPTQPPFPMSRGGVGSAVTYVWKATALWMVICDPFLWFTSGQPGGSRPRPVSVSGSFQNLTIRCRIEINSAVLRSDRRSDQGLSGFLKSTHPFLQSGRLAPSNPLAWMMLLGFGRQSNVFGMIYCR